MKLLSLLSTVLILACSTNQHPTKLQQLELLAKSWGFLKYYHKRIGTTGLNWDSVLVNQVDLIMNQTTENDVNLVLDQLFKPLSQITAYDNIKTQEDSLQQQVSFEWMKSKFILKQHRNRFLSLQTKIDFDNKYVSNKAGSRQLNYARFYEDPMPNADMTKVEYRLLGLFRYWNIINYFFPYKDITDKNWNDVLIEYIPRFIDASIKADYYKELLLLSAEINDAHASIPYHPDLRADFFGRKTIPFSIRYIEKQFIVHKLKSDSLSKLVDIQLGDVILEIDEQDIQSKAVEFGRYVSNSNNAQRYSEISRLLLNGNTESINLLIKRNGSILKRQVNRYSFAELRKYRDRPHVDAWKQLDNQLLYAHMGQLKLDQLSSFFRQVRKQNGLILDFRYYPNWDILFEFLSYFDTENKAFALFKSQYLQKPGFFKWHQDLNSFDFVEAKPNPIQIPIVILVDEYTLSFGEYFVMALQQLEQATVVGSQTAGEDGNQAGIDLPGGVRLFMSSLGIYYPNGELTQRKGIKIDHLVSLSIDDIRYNTDSLIKKAVSIIDTYK